MFLLIDEASKIILDNVLSLGKSITIFDKFLYITKVYNDGISFSMLTGKRWLIVFFSILILIFLYFISYIASFNKLKLTLEILSIFQSDVKELSTVLFISSAFSFIPYIQSFMYSIASLSSISLFSMYKSICSSKFSFF